MVAVIWAHIISVKELSVFLYEHILCILDNLEESIVLLNNHTRGMRWRSLIMFPLHWVCTNAAWPSQSGTPDLSVALLSVAMVLHVDRAVVMPSSFLYALSFDQILRWDYLLMFGTTLCLLSLSRNALSFPPSTPLSRFLPFPPLYSVHLACRWSYYLSLEADEAEKWGDRSFNLAYLSQHTFSLLSSSVPSKLPSKLLLLSCCPPKIWAQPHVWAYI